MAKRGKQKQKQKAKPAAEESARKVDAAPAPAAATEAEADTAAVDEPTPVLAQTDLEASVPADGAPADDVGEAAAEPAAADEAETVATEAMEPAHAAADVAVPGKSRGRARASRPRDPRSPFLVLADYEQRSLAHVAGLPEQLDAPGLWRGVAYRIGTRRLASGFDEVLEILPMPAVTHIPGSLPWMLGVANIRGTLLPVVDLKQFLEGERTVLQEKQRVLVVHQPGGDVAVTIDELYGQRSFVDAQGVDAAAIADGRYAYFVERAYRFGDHDWGVFSLSRLARTPEFRQAAA